MEIRPTGTGDWERFTIVPEKDGLFAIRTHHGNFLSVQDGGAAHKIERREAVGGWEKFRIVKGEGHGYGIKSSHDTFLCVDDTGAVQWNRPAVGGWETFALSVTRLTHRIKVSLQSHHGTFLCAGPDQMEIRPTSDGEWEQFTLIPQAHGTWGILTAHGNYLCVMDKGAGHKIERRPEVGGWETFVIESDDHDRVSIRSSHKTYLCIDDAGGVHWDRDRPNDWEKFHMKRH
eukprot:CAMPEP_0175982852 /NCGR_PEP_ID=MMETSP0108-20121206/48131_1 /TAXON_ID=195067 ORGANISM="Goniomonas pacifica, Strain CCMP1869" /NCGR_SAMPLE_ID=MMETSP0108 /ASSEMBLY_ACC=CAM_ASM_000204 /LENGTH=230 /DNA_ID=CAMNT_0017313559 /DNA_START=95 /DNA_END=788 /DNA_ORIENTATION=+